MDEIREVVLKQLRTGSSPAQVYMWLGDITDELLASAKYLQAIKDSDFAP